jgi:hypothetical protein
MADSEIMGARWGEIQPNGTYVLGKFARMDPNDPQGAIHFDADAVGAHEQIEVTKPDSRYQLRFVAANRIVTFLGIPDAPNGKQVRCFESRPADARGPSESPIIVTMPVSGLIMATVEYIEGGRHWQSVPLTLVRL